MGWSLYSKVCHNVNEEIGNQQFGRFKGGEIRDGGSKQELGVAHFEII